VNKDKIMLPITRSSLSAGGTDTYFEVTELDPAADQIHQIYNIRTDNNVKIRVKQPAATNRFGTNRSPEGGEINDVLCPSIGDGEFVNIWVAQDYPPSIQIENFTDETSENPTIYFIGWRYQIVEVAHKPEVYTEIVIGGIAR